MSAKYGGWHQAQPAWARRAAALMPAAIGQPGAKPKDSWWARPVASREEFDRNALARWREAGWVGKGIQR